MSELHDLHTKWQAALIGLAGRALAYVDTKNAVNLRELRKAAMIYRTAAAEYFDFGTPPPAPPAQQFFE